MKRYRFYFLSIIVGVICAGFFIYQGLVDNNDNSYLAVAEDQQHETDNLFPSPDKTLYQMGLYLDTNNKILYGSTLLKTDNTSGRILNELWFTVYPNAFRKADTTPAPKSAYSQGFDPGWLEFGVIKVNGKAASYSLEGISLQVSFQEEILPDEPITVEMEWKAKIPKVAYRYGTQNNVFMLGNFYPTLNVLSEDWHNSYNTAFGDPFCFHAADYLIRLNTPETYKVASTGQVLQVLAEDNGRQTHLLYASDVRDFSLAVLFDYQELNKVTTEATIKAYVPTHKEEVGQEFLEKAADMLDYFSRQFGSYPYEEFKFVFVPMQGFYGMEYSEIVFLRDEFLNPNYDVSHSQFILAHEIAHQWWYGLVGNDQLKEPWLDEGLANWSAYKYFQNLKGSSNPASNPKGVNLAKEIKDMHSSPEYYQIAYSGGEAFWVGLEKEIGTDKVLKALRRYLDEYKYKIATTPDLLKIIEEEAHQDLDYYFNKWFK